MLNNITRRDIAGDVLTLFDHFEELERENERSKNEINAEPRRSKKEETNYIDVIMLKKGRAQVLNYVLANWYTVDCQLNEDTKKYDYTPYQKWLEKKVSRERMPKDIYMKERKEALKEAKED